LQSILDPPHEPGYLLHDHPFNPHRHRMETLIKLPDSATPSTISEVLASLRKEHFEPRHEAKAWGDWIYLQTYTTVISIESNRGLSSSATIEHGEGEEEGEPLTSLLRAFGRLGWQGVDDDGEFPLG
jgi:hypothetical protein